MIKCYMSDSKDEGGGHKNIGILSNTGPDPPKNHKDTKPAFYVGPTSDRQKGGR